MFLFIIIFLRFPRFVLVITPLVTTNNENVKINKIPLITFYKYNFLLYVFILSVKT